MINYEEGIEQLLTFVFYYGAGAFSPGMFYANQNIYQSLIKYIKRNPRHFKVIKLNDGISYYLLSEDFVETKVGLFNALLYPAPKDYLDTFQAMIYLSLCIEKNEFRKYSLVDFTGGASSSFALDNFEPINDSSGKKTIITIKPRVFQISTFGQKTIVPVTCEFRSVKKILISLANLHTSNVTPKIINDPKPVIPKSSIRKDTDEYLEEVLRKKRSNATSK